MRSSRADGDWRLLRRGDPVVSTWVMMNGPSGHILQLSDSVTNRQAALRMLPGDEELTLSRLLDKYLKHVQIDQLLRESRITGHSADSLYSLQDLVYSSSDSGLLKDMFTGVAFKDEGREGAPVIETGDVPIFRQTAAVGQEIALTDITIDRIYVFYDRNWTGFHARKWERDPGKYAGYVGRVLEEAHGSKTSRELLELGSREHRLKFLKTLSEDVWNSQFENYSRFIGKKLVYKSGDETVDNIMEGRGAICSEKVQALKFLTDHYGFESEYVIAGKDAAGPVPVDHLRGLLTSFDFRFSKRHMRFWQHTALVYNVDGVQVLVDATNGNIPFLFLEGDSAERVLGYEDKQAVPVKMVESTEQFYYHRIPQDIPENLFFAMEGWLPFSDLLQVFDNELGLFLSEDYYVMPIPYRSEKQFRRDRQEYLDASRGARLECSVTAGWTLDTPLGRGLQAAEPEVCDKIMEAEEHLLARIDECGGEGHECGLVLMKLRNGPDQLRG